MDRLYNEKIWMESKQVWDLPGCLQGTKDDDLGDIRAKNPGHFIPARSCDPEGVIYPTAINKTR